MDLNAAIREKLAALEPQSIDLLDESGLHAGHPGAAGGGGHFRLAIASPHFQGKSVQERHRMIYAALGTLMGSRIHALSIRALAPDEL
jgi:BolA protein